DPEYIEIDFIESRVSDHSGIEALTNLVQKYVDLNKNIKLTHLSPECQSILMKSDPGFEKYIETSIDDPRYHVVTDKLDRDI
ncbi:MAG: sodium-independent anion transporter, partial [Marinoscillum sp.]